MVLASFLCLLLKQIINIDFGIPAETNWIFLALILFSGCTYCLYAENYTQISLFNKKLSHKLKSFINLVTALLFILPLAFFIFGTNWHYLPSLWNEVNVSPDTKAYFIQPEIRQISAYVYLLLIFIGTQLLALAGLSQICKAVLNIRDKQHPQNLTPHTKASGSEM